MLPFESPRSLEPLQVGALALPRYGSLTVNEALALEDLSESGDLKAIATLSVFVEGADTLTQAILATLLLVSRDHSGWTLESTLNLPSEQIRSICEFLLNERDRWGEVKAEVDKREYQSFKRSAFDWGALFWRMQRLYPHEARFSARNFGNCSIAQIEQALEAANQLKLEQASSDSQALALLGVSLLSVQGCKDVKPEWFNPFGLELKQQAAKAEIDPAAAKTFLELTRSGDVPGWAIEVLGEQFSRLRAIA